MENAFVRSLWWIIPLVLVGIAAVLEKRWSR